MQGQITLELILIWLKISIYRVELVCTLLQIIENCGLSEILKPCFRNTLVCFIRNGRFQLALVGFNSLQAPICFRITKIT